MGCSQPPTMRIWGRCTSINVLSREHTLTFSAYLGWDFGDLDLHHWHLVVVPDHAFDLHLPGLAHVEPVYTLEQVEHQRPYHPLPRLWTTPRHHRLGAAKAIAARHNAVAEPWVLDLEPHESHAAIIVQCCKPFHPKARILLGPV